MQELELQEECTDSDAVDLDGGGVQPVQVLKLQNQRADIHDGTRGSILKDVMLFVPEVMHEIRRPDPPLPEIRVKDGCLNAPTVKLLCATIEAEMFDKAYSPAWLRDLRFCTVTVNLQNSGPFEASNLRGGFSVFCFARRLWEREQ